MNSAATSPRISDLGTGAIVRIVGRKTTMTVAAISNAPDEFGYAALVDEKGRTVEVIDCGTHWLRCLTTSHGGYRPCEIAVVVPAPAAVAAA